VQGFQPRNSQKNDPMPIGITMSESLRQLRSLMIENAGSELDISCDCALETQSKTIFEILAVLWVRK
jgi:hypothetical protein